MHSKENNDMNSKKNSSLERYNYWGESDNDLAAVVILVAVVRYIMYTVMW